MIEVMCDYETDPPYVKVTVAGVFIGAFPLQDYYKIQPALGLPDIVCDTPPVTGA